LIVLGLVDGRPAGGGPPSGGRSSRGEGAEGNHFFEGSVDTVGLDVAVKETPDVMPGESFVGGFDGFADTVGDGSPVEMPKRRAALASQ
jgi:hypothetical protein